MALTDVEIRKAKAPPNAYKLADAHGLFLHLTAGASKFWRMKYRHGGREGLLSFGPYPEVTLAKAREKRNAAREQSGREAEAVDQANAWVQIDENGLPHTERVRGHARLEEGQAKF